MHLWKPFQQRSAAHEATRQDKTQWDTALMDTLAANGLKNLN